MVVDRWIDRWIYRGDVFVGVDFFFFSCGDMLRMILIERYFSCLRPLGKREVIFYQWRKCNLIALDLDLDNQKPLPKSLDLMCPTATFSASCWGPLWMIEGSFRLPEVEQFTSEKWWYRKMMPPFLLGRGICIYIYIYGNCIYIYISRGYSC